MNYENIENVEIEDIESEDYPDFANAFIASADINGRPMTEDELETLNEDNEFVQKQVQDYLY